MRNVECGTRNKVNYILTGNAEQLENITEGKHLQPCGIRIKNAEQLKNYCELMNLKVVKKQSENERRMQKLFKTYGTRMRNAK